MCENFNEIDFFSRKKIELRKGQIEEIATGQLKFFRLSKPSNDDQNFE